MVVDKYNIYYSHVDKLVRIIIIYDNTNIYTFKLLTYINTYKITDFRQK